MVKLSINKTKGSKMAKFTAPTVGSQFTTLKSKVTGEVVEVIKNKNGSYRVRLDVKGEPRWTTITKS
jgi:predicted lipoprotein